MTAKPANETPGTPAEGEYTGLTNLTAREQVRHRPSTHIGGTGNSALAHLTDEIMANSADEALVGYCKNVEVTIHKNQSITIADDGRGVPLSDTLIKASGKVIPGPEAAFTEANTGGKYDDTAYSSSGGMNGLGAKAVTFLSKETSVEVKRDGKRYRQTYKNGPLIRVPNSDNVLSFGAFTVEPPKI